jgi:predicted RNase H-like HicB family nuclease
MIQAVVRTGDESGFVAECAELNVVTQGASLDDVARNLREAIGLAISGENLAELGIDPHPPQPVSIRVSMSRSCEG